MCAFITKTFAFTFSTANSSSIFFKRFPETSDMLSIPLKLCTKLLLGLWLLYHSFFHRPAGWWSNGRVDTVSSSMFAFIRTLRIQTPIPGIIYFPHCSHFLLYVLFNWRWLGWFLASPTREFSAIAVSYEDRLFRPGIETARRSPSVSCPDLSDHIADEWYRPR